MSRPRWHDVLIAFAIAAVLGYGSWALWWGDVGSRSEDAASGSAVPTSGSVSSAPQT
jgi:hypothetical protein